MRDVEGEGPRGMVRDNEGRREKAEIYEVKGRESRIAQGRGSRIVRRLRETRKNKQIRAIENRRQSANRQTRQLEVEKKRKKRNRLGSLKSNERN